MKQFTLLIVIVLLYFSQCNNSIEDCKNLVHEIGNPFDCCIFPFASNFNTSAEDCQRTDTCAYFDCVTDKLQLFVDEKFNATNMVEYFMHSFDFLTFPRGNWPEIVKQSLETCEALSEFVNFLKFLVNFF